MCGSPRIRRNLCIVFFILKNFKTNRFIVYRARLYLYLSVTSCEYLGANRGFTDRVGFQIVIIGGGEGGGEGEGGVDLTIS